MACELANAAGVKQLALFHHDPNYDDATVRQLETQAQALLPASFASREGLEVTLCPKPAIPAARKTAYEKRPEGF